MCAGNNPTWTPLQQHGCGEGKQNPATAYSAPSAAALTAASTTAAQARPITSFFQHKEESYSTPVAAAAAAAAAGTATGANVAATALAQQLIAEPLAVAHTSAR